MFEQKNGFVGFEIVQTIIFIKLQGSKTTSIALCEDLKNIYLHLATSQCCSPNDQPKSQTLLQNLQTTLLHLPTPKQQKSSICNDKYLNKYLLDV